MGSKKRLWVPRLLHLMDRKGWTLPDGLPDNTFAPLIIRCHQHAEAAEIGDPRIHHEGYFEFKTAAAHVLRGSDCSACQRREWVILLFQRAKDQNWTFPNGIPETTQEAIPVRCHRHAVGAELRDRAIHADGYFEWNTSPDTLRRHGCPACATRSWVPALSRLARKKRWTLPNGIPVRNNTEKFPLRCHRHSKEAAQGDPGFHRDGYYEWRAVANSVLSGTGCPSCAGKTPITLARVKWKLRRDGRAGLVHERT